jgi:hypothetical protein
VNQVNMVLIWLIRKLKSIIGDLFEQCKIYSLLMCHLDVLTCVASMLMLLLHALLVIVITIVPFGFMSLSFSLGETMYGFNGC